MRLALADLPTNVERQIVLLESAGAPVGGPGNHPCQGLYTYPTARRPRVAFIASHYSVDFSEHYLGPPLAARGLGFLGWNTRYRGHDHLFDPERALADIEVGARWLRSQGVEVVVLLGNSGGGSLMACYQASGRAPGDLYVSVAAHPGRPEVLTAWMDPAVADEADPATVDAELDLYRRVAPYDPGFVERYRAAQIARNRRITLWAQAELDRLGELGVADRLFTVARTWADPRFTDATIDPSRRPVPACYRGDPRSANVGVLGLAAVTSLRSWLAMWSIETTGGRAVEDLGRLDVPALVVSADADTGVFPSDAATIFGALGSADKQLLTIAGDHYFASPAGARVEVADAITGWLQSRVG